MVAIGFFFFNFCGNFNFFRFGLYGYTIYIQNLENPKKTKAQNLYKIKVPISGMGSIFLFFWFFVVKPKKQNGRTYVPVSGMASIFVFFLVFRGFYNFLIFKMGSAAYFCITYPGAVLLQFFSRLWEAKRLVTAKRHRGQG